MSVLFWFVLERNGTFYPLTLNTDNKCNRRGTVYVVEPIINLNILIGEVFNNDQF